MTDTAVPTAYWIYMILRFTNRANRANWGLLADTLNNSDSRFFGKLHQLAVDPDQIIELSKFSQGTGKTPGATPNLDKFEYVAFGIGIRVKDKYLFAQRLADYATQYSIDTTGLFDEFGELVGSVAKDIYEQVFQAEIQQAATDLGFGAQAPNLTVTVSRIGQDQDAVVNNMKAYIAANLQTVFYE